MDLFQKHSDTIVILGSFVLCFWTLNEKVNVIEKDITIIKTVLAMKNIMPTELATNGEK